MSSVPPQIFHRADTIRGRNGGCIASSRRAAWRAQRDAWKAQQHAYKAKYQHAMDRGFLLWLDR